LITPETSGNLVLYCINFAVQFHTADVQTPYAVPK